MKTATPTTDGGADNIGGPPSPASLTATLLRVRELLKSPDGSSLILDYRVRQAIFAIETELGGIRHGS